MLKASTYSMQMCTLCFGHICNIFNLWRYRFKCNYFCFSFCHPGKSIKMNDKRCLWFKKSELTIIACGKQNKTIAIFVRVGIVFDFHLNSPLTVFFLHKNTYSLINTNIYGIIFFLRDLTLYRVLYKCRFWPRVMFRFLQFSPNMHEPCYMPNKYTLRCLRDETSLKNCQQLKTVVTTL